jgi:Na+-translocating ferredoxin:NAD+ oxidoreductase RNF subunit RnfB
MLLVMSEASFQALAKALDRLPNGYPRTDSGVEILILKKIFTAEEATLASLLGRELESSVSIAARAGASPREARHALLQMAKRGLVWAGRNEQGPAFRLAPFVVGIYEASLEWMDHELAHLFEDYMAQGGAKGIMGPLPSLHRVVPAHGSVKSEWILPYDEVRALLLEGKAFSVRDCICRKEQDLLGRRSCSFPLHNCLSLSLTPRPARPEDTSQEEAVAILDQAEDVGLVHTVSNVRAGVNYVCNCCGCCCGILRGITEYGLEHSVAAANYLAAVDPDTCTGCGTCLDRCQVGAMSLQGETALADPKRCIGCGLCVTGCPAEAVTLKRKPEEQIVHPPADFAAWERERLGSRQRS